MIRPAKLMALTALLGLGLSILAVPGAREEALMFLKNRDYDRASELLNGLASKGDQSIATVQETIALLTESDIPEGVIPLLEKYVREHPDDLEGHRQLASRYADGQLPEAQLGELLAMQRLAPEVSRQREIERLMCLMGDERGQMAALAATVRQSGGRPSDYIELADFQASTGHREDAIKTLDALKIAAPAAFVEDIAEFRQTLAASPNAPAPVAEPGGLPGTGADAIRELAALGAFDRLLPALETLVAANPEAWLSDYVHQANDAHAPDRLTPFLTGLIAEPGRPLKQHLLIVRTLIAQGHPEPVLPALAALADQHGGAVADLYLDTLNHLGRSAERRDYLVRLAAKPGTTDEQRRAIAWQMWETGDTAEALTLFTALADGEGPDGQDVGTLIRLWGPEPTSVQVAWIEQRLTSAPVADRAAWMAWLTAVGEPRRAAELYALTDAPSEAMRDARFNALLVLDDGLALAAALTEDIAAAPTEPPAHRLEALCAKGYGARQADVAETACAAWLQAVPQDGRAHRLLGLSALADNDVALARRELAAWHAVGPADWQSAAAAGEAELESGDYDASLTFFAQALDIMGDSKADDVILRNARAYLLLRLGRTAEANAERARLVTTDLTGTTLTDHPYWLVADALRIGQ